MVPNNVLINIPHDCENVIDALHRNRSGKRFQRLRG